jgi:hypothetical protein
MDVGIAQSGVCRFFMFSSAQLSTAPRHLLISFVGMAFRRVLHDEGLIWLASYVPWARGGWNYRLHLHLPGAVAASPLSLVSFKFADFGT